GMAEDVGAQAIEGTFEDDDGNQADDQHIQRRHAFVDQYLVHDDLEEQRADQGEQLQHERDQQHFTQQLAVLDQRRDEPGEVEAGEFAGQAGAAGDQDQLASPLRGESIDRFDGGTRAGGGRVLQEYALAVALSQDDVPDGAVLTARGGQGRQWRERQAGNRRAGQLGFQA